MEQAAQCAPRALRPHSRMVRSRQLAQQAQTDSLRAETRHADTLERPPLQETR